MRSARLTPPALAGAEAWCWRAQARSTVATERFAPPLFYRRDRLLDIALQRDRQVVARREHRGELLYEATYTTNEHGLRTMPPSAAGRCVVFFGGSFTFGLGIDDREAMPYRVARGGLGPWDENGPRYELGAAGEVRCRGTFADFDRLRDLVARRMLGRSHFLQATVFDSQRIYTRHAKLYAAIVARARDVVCERYPAAAVHVLYWDADRPGRPDPGGRTLEGHDLQIHPVSAILPGLEHDSGRRYRLHPLDRHPSPAANDLIAAYVVERILQGPGG